MEFLKDKQVGTIALSIIEDLNLSELQKERVTNLLEYIYKMALLQGKIEIVQENELLKTETN